MSNVLRRRCYKHGIVTSEKSTFKICGLLAGRNLTRAFVARIGWRICTRLGLELELLIPGPERVYGKRCFCASIGGLFGARLKNSAERLAADLNCSTLFIC